MIEQPHTYIKQYVILFLKQMCNFWEASNSELLYNDQLQIFYSEMHMTPVLHMPPWSANGHFLYRLQSA
jgi:hypothetical protein